jgi:carbohydrate-selective porin OprB
VNVVSQANPAFDAAYSGPQSFGPGGESAASYVVTLYTGFVITPRTDLALDVESAAGRGLSQAFGIASFPNLDVVRNPALPHVPYVGRAILRHIVPLSDDLVPAERGPLSLEGQVPARRLELRAGKFDTVDYFDVNGVGSDTHLQFLNWAVDTNGAFDYAADTRGYTLGVEAEYQDPAFALRVAEVLMPKVANGIDYDFDIAHARGENLELERHGTLLGRKGAVRVLAFRNHARMGDYAQANAAFLAGAVPRPDITATRAPDRIKYGFGLNVESELTPSLRGFLRLGFDDGRTESFAFTEIDDTVAVGADLKAAFLGRPKDKMGLAFVTSGLSPEHRTYLALGGLGFLLGDGALAYGRETVEELYYTAHAYRGVYPALDVQRVENPGFNRARGPALVATLRLHLDF